MLPQWIIDFSSIAGIAGLVITIIVMTQVSQIKSTYKSRARLPEVKRQLEKAGSSLNKQLSDWPAKKNEARSHIKMASTLVGTAISTVNGNDKKELKQVGDRLSAAVNDFSSAKYNAPEEAWEIYSDIQVSVLRIDQILKNLRWE